MKFFAKYLPVEGEINIGDYVQYEGFTHYVSKAVLESYPTEVEKVKLFLCSRDIQVGDEIYTDDPFWPQFTKLQYEQENKDMDEPRTTECFKVIGEISPNAIWVKEGDEFDYPNECTIPMVEMFQKQAYCLIKCPCCKQFL